MKGLMIKDFYMTMKYCRSYLFMAVIFIACYFFTETPFFVIYPCLLCGMIPVNLLAYDEHSHWNQYSETLPYTKGQLVSSKYLIGLITQGAMLLVMGATGVAGTFQLKEFAVLILLLFLSSIIAPAISLPFIFKMGVEKGRIGYLVMVGFICAVVIIATGIFQDNLATDILSSGMLPVLPIICLVLIALYIFSWRLSIAFYSKREV